MARKNDKDSTISHRFPKQIDQEAFEIMISDWNSKNEDTKLQMRMLELSDCQPGSAYSQLIGCTSLDVPSPHDLQSWFSTKTHFPNGFHTFIISDKTTLLQIATCTLAIEHKFFASLCTIGHISQITITPTHPDPAPLHTELTHF
jgi:Ca2+-dependent lipid-binding protein